MKLGRTTMNNNSTDKTWDFWYNDEDDKMYVLYETIEKNISVLRLVEKEILE